ncbi:MAG: hypothetical protein AVDCRST_MAG96-3723 [uncultured Segetibacter sp.]|uniref:Uncharacterized protein n=1 Tax=uncultured Segetibacter sp. TaxID=481133 RepID=A0A6J4TW35_9BACT|nr:MAG: hypothetical protein AVDCRST_MAG96-3723 [uncultured Segetibacter sp.]
MKKLVIFLMQYKSGTQECLIRNSTAGNKKIIFISTGGAVKKI